MEKILIIIKREYLSRIRKKSFIMMTLLGPLLMAGISIIPVWLTGVTDGSRKVIVVSEIPSFKNVLKNTGTVQFVYDFYDIDLSTVRQLFKDSSDYSVLYIPYNVSYSNQVTLHSKKQPGMNVLSYISNTLSDEIEKAKLYFEHVDPSVIDKVKTNVSVVNNVDDRISDTGLNVGLGLFTAVLIYMFIFLYSSQVMRGVIEEKTSRVIEVIISSVKPFQLMTGKIIGVAMVGLTQFLLWIILTFSIYMVAKSSLQKVETDFTRMEQTFKSNASDVTPITRVELSEQGKVVFENISRINWTLVLSTFIFYFLGGYLLYSALFAAIGAAVDNETDTQQFVLPVTIPLIMSFLAFNLIIENPDGSVAFWLSMIPFTSPLVMMVRIPFGIATWELLLSMSLLILGFIATTWIAGRIYRTGILVYGKKIDYKELWKWLLYKG